MDKPGNAQEQAASGQPTNSSQLFLVRMWTEDGADGAPAMAGKVQHVLSGEARHFNDWATLESVMASMLGARQGAGALSLVSN